MVDVVEVVENQRSFLAENPILSQGICMTILTTCPPEGAVAAALDCSRRISRGFSLFLSITFSKSPMSNRTALPNLTN